MTKRQAEAIARAMYDAIGRDYLNTFEMRNFPTEKQTARDLREDPESVSFVLDALSDDALNRRDIDQWRAFVMVSTWIDHPEIIPAERM